MLLSSKADASLLIDTDNNIPLQSKGTFDNVVSARRFVGFAGSYYDIPYSMVDVSTNGNLNFTFDSAFNNTPMPTTVPRISPLWDDLVVSGSNESVSEKLSSGLYYSVTWLAHQKGTGADVAFQVTLFGMAAKVRGFNFLAGDIAFSYASVSGSFTGGDATIGLDRGNNSIFVPLPGDDDGVIKNGLVSLLPTGTGQFMLFRRNEASYNASIQVVPEPSVYAICFSCFAAILVGRKAKHRLS